MKNFLDDIIAGNVKDVEWALKQEPRLAYSRDPSGVSAILVAAYNGQDEITEILSRAVERLDIFEAAATGRHDRVAEHLGENPDLARENAPDGFSALGLAAFFGRVDIVDLLLEHGAEPGRASNNPMRVAPLHSAVANGDSEKALAMAEKLLKAGAPPNAAQAGGWTPLHQAAANGNEPLVRLLLEHGADGEALSDDERTPRDMAQERGHETLVPLFAVTTS